MFEIKVLSEADLGSNNERLGTIAVGDFSERFACSFPKEEVEQLESLWKSQLGRLLEGEKSVALVHDPRFAWVIYRDGSECFVQQVFSENGDFSEHLTKRVTVNEDGERISEWSTTIDEISRFVGL